MGDSVAPLPSYIWEIVVGYLDGLSLYRLASSCSWFYELIESTCDWRRLVQKTHPKAVPSIVHVSPDCCKFDVDSMQTSLCRKISIINGGVELMSSLLKSQSHRSEQRQKSSQITTTNFCCGYLIVGCLDGSIGVFEPIVNLFCLHLFRLGEFPHSRK